MEVGIISCIRGLVWGEFPRPPIAQLHMRHAIGLSRHLSCCLRYFPLGLGLSAPTIFFPFLVFPFSVWLSSVVTSAGKLSCRETHEGKPESLYR